MNAQTGFFYLFALVTILAAARVITARNPVHSAMFLVLTFVSAAGVWLLLQAEFLAIVLVLVYVGAVMVLFLFVVMMLDIHLDQLGDGLRRNATVAIGVGVLIVVELAVVVWVQFGQVKATDAPVLPPDFSNTEALGELLYTDYVYPLQIAGAILLIAMVAAIALTLRRRKDAKSQRPGEQVRVKAADRLRMVRVPSAVPHPTSPAAIAAAKAAAEAAAAEAEAAKAAAEAAKAAPPAPPAGNAPPAAPAGGKA